MQALAPDPMERFASARDMANALDLQLQEVAPGFNDSHLSRFMKGLFEDEVGSEAFGMAATRDIERATERIPTTRRRAPVAKQGKNDGSLEDPVLMALAEKVKDTPNLWTLVEMAEHLVRLGRAADAQRTLRVAGTKFAQNGLLVQAVAIYVRIKDLTGWSASLAL
ncbi:unnamed protein product, partial [Laminaria digitata]